MKKKLTGNNKIALIVEGGGFKSGFTAGIIDSFIINKFNPFHLYLGVSGGAMNLTSYISRQYKRNVNIISSMSVNTNFISIVRFLKGGNYMELKYLMEVALKEYPFDKKNLFFGGVNAVSITDGFSDSRRGGTFEIV